MDITFIRHGHAEHLLHYPHQLNQLHPGLTEQGKRQATELRKQIKILPEDLVLVSPSKRTIETAFLLTSSDKLTVCPLVGPRMFPQNPEFPVLRCDQIYSKDELNAQYAELRILDFGLDCWLDGINRMEEYLFEVYAGQLIQWCREQSGSTFIISHDGTITSYRVFLGEQGLTRSDFLGEAEEIIQFHMDDSGCRYGLFNKVNNHFLGTVGFHCWAKSEPSSAELGFDLSRSYWGQGLMQEALIEIIKIGWNVMNLDFIEATVEQANIRSQNLLVKMHFSKADELKGDLFYYTLNKEEFIL